MTLDYFPFYYDRWMKSTMRATCSATERGIYLELLFRCCAEGSIPTDLRELAGLAKCTFSEIKKAWPRLERAFQVVDGKYVNSVSLEVRMAVAGTRARAKRGASARWESGSQADAMHAPSICDASLKHMPNACDADAQPMLSESRKQKAERKLTPPPSARAPREGEPEPAQAVREAVERCSQFWPKIGNKRYAEAAWTREALDSAQGIVAWASAIVATAEDHAEAHREALAKNPKHYIPTLERWVAEGDYTSPPPGGSRIAEKARLRSFNEQQRIKTLREVAANNDPEDWAVEARQSAIHELQGLGLEP